MRKHSLNILGIVLGFAIIICSLFFTLWQLDIILSGCVWNGNEYWGWHADTRYADQYFQCFLWKTDIGTAYDTLFLYNFLGPIIGAVMVFISVWRWEDE